LLCVSPKILFSEQTSFYKGGHYEYNESLKGRYTDHGDAELYVAKFTASGTQVWVSTEIRSAEPEYSTDTCVDGDDNVYTTGFTRGSVIGANAGDFDIFVVKYNSTGGLVWKKQIGTPHHDEGRKVYIQGGFLYVVGHTWGVLDDRAHAGINLFQSGQRDIVLLKLTVDGARVWTRQLGTSANDYSFGLAFEPGTPYLFLSGRTSGGGRASGPSDRASATNSVQVESGIYSSGERHPNSRFAVEERSYNFVAKYDTGGGELNKVVEGGIRFSHNSLTVSEGGVADSYSVVLCRQPASSVTVHAQMLALNHPQGSWNSQRSENVYQASLSPSKLIFTTRNWQVPQFIDVAAIDDEVDEAFHYTTILHQSTSSDINYDSQSTPFLDGSNISVTIADNDNATIAISKNHAYVVEGGATDAYTIHLTSQPLALVTIHVVSTSQTNVSPKKLTFSSDNWTTPQTVVINAVDDILSENVHGGTHSGGKVGHYASSSDFHYHTRRPRCYYVERCNCTSVSTAGTCNASAIASGCLNATILRCDVDALKSSDGQACQSFAFGNGACENIVYPSGKDSSAQASIPPRFGAKDPNPNPPSYTLYLDHFGELQLEAKIMQAFMGTAPVDSGYGANHTPHPAPHKFSLVDNSNLHPRNGSVEGIDLNLVPSDVLAHMLGFLGVPNFEGLQELSRHTNSFFNVSNPPEKLVAAGCRGAQRLTLQQWAYTQWQPGMAEKVLAAVILAFPNLEAVDIANCGLAIFNYSSSIQVAIVDNDPGVTISKLYLTAAEGGAVDTYSVVLNAPPVQSTSSDRVQWQSTTAMCDAVTTTSPLACSYIDATRGEDQYHCFNSSANAPCAAGATFPRRMPNRDDAPTQPGGVVTVAVVVDAHLSVNPAFLTFSSTDWHVPQVVSVQAVDDFVDESTENHTIGHSVTSNDFAYSGAQVPFWAGPYVNRNPDPFWAGSEDSSFNPHPDYDYNPYHSRILVSVHDNDKAGVNVLQPTVFVAESGVIEYSHSGDIMLLGPVSDATIDKYQPDLPRGTATGLDVLFNSSDTLIKFDLPQSFPGFEAETIGDFRLRLYKTIDGSGAGQKQVLGMHYLDLLCCCSNVCLLQESQSAEHGAHSYRGRSCKSGCGVDCKQCAESIFDPLLATVNDDSSASSSKSSSGGGILYRLTAVANDWTEDSVTWNTQPPPLRRRVNGPLSALAALPSLDVFIGTGKINFIIVCVAYRFSGRNRAVSRGQH
jgi:hypothetical protein